MLRYLLTLFLLISCSNHHSSEGQRKPIDKLNDISNELTFEIKYIRSYDSYRKYSSLYDNVGTNKISPEHKSEILSRVKGQDFYQNYIVNKGDTLMFISFKIYGNINRWREIYSLNKDKIPSPHRLESGTSLRFKVDSSNIKSWPPSGEPYLIRRGDTLGSISFYNYGHKKYWKSIYEHNKFLIKDPNKIYAGFTIYLTSPPLN